MPDSFQTQPEKPSETSRNFDKLGRCPYCGKNSLQLNPETRISICLNKECNPIIADTALDPTKPSSENFRKQNYFKNNFVSRSNISSEGEGTMEQDGSKSEKNLLNRLPAWLMSLILLIMSFLIGMGISLISKTNIPVWLFLSFAVVFCVENWFLSFTREIKILGNIYKIFLNLSILFTLSLAVWSLVKLFTHDFTVNPLVGSLVFVAEVCLFVWLCKMKARNNWLWPSMTFTIFCLCMLMIIFAFAGVSPFAEYKDIFWQKVSAWFTSWLP